MTSRASVRFEKDWWISIVFQVHREIQSLFEPKWSPGDKRWVMDFFINIPHCTPPYMFVVACFFFVCLEFQIIRFVISTFTPILFIEISFVLHPPPPYTSCSDDSLNVSLDPMNAGLQVLEGVEQTNRICLGGGWVKRRKFRWRKGTNLEQNNLKLQTKKQVKLKNLWNKKTQNQLCRQTSGVNVWSNSLFRTSRVSLKESVIFLNCWVRTWPSLQTQKRRILSDKSSLNFDTWIRPPPPLDTQQFYLFSLSTPHIYR